MRALKTGIEMSNLYRCVATVKLPPAIIAWNGGGGRREEGGERGGRVEERRGR